MRVACVVISIALASPSAWPAEPSFGEISRCFFVYAAIFQVGRDHRHQELFQFGQARVGFVTGYMQANNENREFNRVFDANLDANKRAGIQVEETLLSALRLRNQSQFNWALNQAIACDRQVAIKTEFVPRL